MSSSRPRSSSALRSGSGSRWVRLWTERRAPSRADNSSTGASTRMRRSGRASSARAAAPVARPPAERSPSVHRVCGGPSSTAGRPAGRARVTSRWIASHWTVPATPSRTEAGTLARTPRTASTPRRGCRPSSGRPRRPVARLSPGPGRPLTCRRLRPSTASRVRPAPSACGQPGSSCRSQADRRTRRRGEGDVQSRSQMAARMPASTWSGGWVASRTTAGVVDQSVSNTSPLRART